MTKINLEYLFPHVNQYYWVLVDEEKKAIKEELSNVEVVINKEWFIDNLIGIDDWYCLFLIENYSYDILIEVLKKRWLWDKILKEII